MDRTDLAWAAGFWDGEGSAYLVGKRQRRRKQPHARINQSSLTGVPDVLTRFQRIVGLGRVQGPDLREGREPLYRWETGNQRGVRRIAALLWPWLGKVKRKQLDAVVPTTAAKPMSWAHWPEAERRAWCAGLWDGEGSICLLKHRSHAGHFVPEASITQSSSADRPDVLVRIATLANGGYWYGPYEQPKAKLPVYRWKLFRPDQIRLLYCSLWPWLGPVKRDQFRSAFGVLESQPPLPRGNPAWGSHKTHCLRGHEYATARIRPFRGRGRNTQAPRASHQCLTCVREWHRQHRTPTKE